MKLSQILQIPEHNFISYESSLGTRYRATSCPNKVYCSSYETLGHWTRKLAKCCNQGLMDHPNRSLEVSSSESNME